MLFKLNENESSSEEDDENENKSIEQQNHFKSI